MCSLIVIYVYAFFNKEFRWAYKGTNKEKEVTKLVLNSWKTKIKMTINYSPFTQTANQRREFVFIGEESYNQGKSRNILLN